MQHAEHFLSRLDRLPRSEVDLALELYRDPDLLRAILEGASLPERAERVAISIDDPIFGPFLVVTRAGHFVTCLGRGMRAGDLPIVTRAALDAASRNLDRLREKMAVSQRIKGDRASAQLIRRLLVTPDSVAREDFLTVAAWEPLLGPVFLDMYVGMACELLQQAPLLRRVRVRGARGEEALHTYWDLLHAAGHMALLGAMTGEKEAYATLTEQHLGARSAFSWALTGTGVLTFMLKGAWAAGRMGKMMLAEYKRALGDDVALFELFDTLFALLALGTRVSGTRAEILKALRAAPSTARTPEAQRLREKAGREVELMCEVTAQLMESPPEELAETHVRFGETFFERAPEGLTEEMRATREDLVRTLPLLSWADGITGGKKLMMSMSLIAATARGAPEQFYLPREIMRELRRPWEPAFTWQVLDPLMRAERAGRKPDVRQVTIGRNDPCSCGSGKKWKRCCGA